MLDTPTFCGTVDITLGLVPRSPSVPFRFLYRLLEEVFREKIPLFREPFLFSNQSRRRDDGWEVWCPFRLNQCRGRVGYLVRESN